MLAAVLPLTAGTVNPLVDVSNATTQLLNPLDQLLFTISGSEALFLIGGSQTGAGYFSHPTHIAFEFLSEPQTRPGDFTAVLESADGSVTLDLPEVFRWLPGASASSDYIGPVSVLYGSFDLPAPVAEELFSGPDMVLAIQNRGSPVTVGLPSNTLENDLNVTFSIPGLGVSAPIVNVQYQDPPPSVPEPNPAWPLLAVGALSAGAAKVLHRLGRPGIQ